MHCKFGDIQECGVLECTALSTDTCIHKRKYWHIDMHSHSEMHESLWGFWLDESMWKGFQFAVSHVEMHMNMCEFKCVCACAHTKYVGIWVKAYACVYARVRQVCRYVSVRICMYVCTCECSYIISIYTHVYIYIHIWITYVNIYTQLHILVYL